MGKSMRFFRGKGFEGKSLRFGIILSFEKHSNCLIIHFARFRYWIGIVKDDYDKQTSIMRQPDDI
jgi:hypothetical protein